MNKCIKKALFTLTILLLISIFHCSNLYAKVSYSFTGKFKTAGFNPSDPWSYGWMDTGFTTLTLFDQEVWGGIGNGREWCTTNYPWGSIWENNTNSIINGVSPGQVALNSAYSDTPTVARWTAPSYVNLYGNTAAIDGQFFNGEAGMLVDVRINGTEIWNAVGCGSFNLITSISPNDTIDFTVRAGSYGGGDTPLDVSISIVPEPATLLFLGLGGMFLRKRMA